MPWFLLSVSLAIASEPSPTPASCRAARANALARLEDGDATAWSSALETGKRCQGALPLGPRPARWARQGRRAYDQWDGEAAEAAASRATLWALATAGPTSDAVAGTASLLAHAMDLAWTSNPERREVVGAVFEEGEKGWLAMGVSSQVAGDGEAAEVAYERVIAEGEGADRALAANNLGILRDDEALLTEAVSGFEASRGPEHPALAMSLTSLAHLHKARRAFDEALPLYVRALDIYERALGPDHMATASSLNNLALLHKARGALDEALPLLTRALDIHERVLGRDHPDTATCLNNLASVHRARAAYDEALPLYVRALDIRERSLGPDHPDTASSLNFLAVLHLDRGAYDEALPLFVRALEIRERTLGPSHPDTAQSVGNVGAVHQALGAYDEALPLAVRAVELKLRALGPDHPDTATSINNLAVLHELRDAYDEAFPLYLRALDIRERTLGPDHPDTAISLNDLADLHEARGRYDEALALCRRALDIRERALGPDHPDTARSLNSLAGLLAARGDHDEALPLYLRALDIRERRLGPDHPATATSLSNLAGVQRARGAYDEALPLYVRALDIRERSLGLDHADTANSLNNLALLHQARGAFDEALPLYARALDIHERVLGPDHRATATSLNNLAALHMNRGAYEEALPLYGRALHIYERTLGGDHPETSSGLNNLAALHLARGAYDEALPLYVRALDIRERALGSDHPSTATSLNNLARLHRVMGHPELARPLVERALPVALDTSDVTTRLRVLAGAADQSALEGDLPGAALWGKLAVRDVEALRSRVAKLSHSDAASASAFLSRYADIYRHLADRLVTLGRLPEAEQVLSLLKTEEQHRYQRRDGGGSGTVALTEAEQAWYDRFAAIRDTVVADAKEYDVLRKQAARGLLPAASQPRLDELTARREAAAETTRLALVELQAALAGAGRDESWGRLALERTDRVQRQLKTLGAGAVLVHAILLEEQVLLLLTTPEAQLAERVAVPAADVHRAVADLRAALTDPSQDPRPAAKKLYGWLLRPLEGHLDQAGATTLLTYLDGVLRYVPMAALHDGERFVVERWATSVYTAAAESDLARAPVDDPFVAAFGASRGGTIRDITFAGLPSVADEVDTVVRSDDADPGAVSGRAYLDEAFTAASLADALHLGTPWLHVASHFYFAPGGTEADSFLVLGDGSALSVADLRTGDYSFAEVDLLALSACETAMGEQRADGSEVEGLAVVAQNRGAAAVLATLWPVADASTAAWMASLYQGQVEDPVRRAAAVQRVQQAFLTGAVDASRLPTSARGLVVQAGPATAGPPSGLEGWKHPYFWAPFVLYGAGR